MRGWGFYRPGRRAVGSRSQWGMRNIRAISRYIPDETDMAADERKSTMLPCGFTIAESWAALRKSWLAFNISHSNGDWTAMSNYANRIRKIQRQMGIQLTDFDSDIVVNEEVDEEEEEQEAGQEVGAEEGASDISNEEVSTLDYDGIMEHARMKVNGENATSTEPRGEIFAKTMPGDENLDNYLRQGESYMRHSVSTSNITRACLYRRRREDAEGDEEVENGPKSCFYERK